jgi:hypothetical protein
MRKQHLFIQRICDMGVILTLMTSLSNCSDNSGEAFSLPESSQQPTTRTIYDDNFDWENSSYVRMVGPNGSVAENIPLPWAPGGPSAAVPLEWKEYSSIEQIPYEQRMYTRANHWELLYSNVATASAYKYIVMYNKITGIMRCFTYIYGNPSFGTSDCAWSIGINGTTSLLNFNAGPVVLPASSKTNNQTFAVSEGNAGYIIGAWYGFEVECAYDPSLRYSRSKMLISARAFNTTKTKGKSETLGDITGTATTTGSNNSGMNLSLSNMFNQSITQTETNSVAVEGVANKIENGINSGNNFFKSLWNNVKTNASKWVSSGLEAGVKEGIKAIVLAGPEAMVGSLLDVFTSMIGGNKPITTRIDMKTKLSTDYEFNSETTLAGWGTIDMPLYDASSALYKGELGVWSIETTPIIHLYLTTTFHIKDPEPIIPTRKQPIDKPGTTITQSLFFKCTTPTIILNPEIKEKFSLVNLSLRYLDTPPQGFNGPTLRPVLVDNRQLYHCSGVFTRMGIGYSFEEGDIYSTNSLMEVSFKLVNKGNPLEEYVYKKIFRATTICAGVNEERIEY